MSEATPCKSCGNPVSGLYCSACGEKVLTPADHTLKHYLGALLNAFTFADSKLWNTLKAVVLRPGELSAAYMDGRRMKYMRPVAFFFLANFIYFTVPLFETFNSSLSTQLSSQNYSTWARQKVEAQLIESGSTMEEFAARYEPASTNNAKLLLVAMVFLLVVPLALLYLRKSSYASAYVTAAFELMAFHLWVSTLLLGLITFGVVELMRSVQVPVEPLSVDTVLFVPFLLLHLWVTLGLSRRFFGCSWWGSLWRTVLMYFGLALALTSYRLLLFMFTFWQVS